MIVAIHVAIAVLGIIWTTFGYIKPSDMNLRASYALVVLTFVSGFYLVVSGPADILRMCLSGLAYLVVVMAGVYATRRKLTTLRSEDTL